MKAQAVWIQMVPQPFTCWKSSKAFRFSPAGTTSPSPLLRMTTLALARVGAAKTAGSSDIVAVNPYRSAKRFMELRRLSRLFAWPPSLESSYRMTRFPTTLVKVPAMASLNLQVDLDPAPSQEQMGTGGASGTA
jgi:hypothetical protein